MKKTVLFFLVTFNLIVVAQEKISTSDTILQGFKSDTSNKRICAEKGDTTIPCLRFNTSIDEWEFSNDGSSYSGFGSGVGGFVNPMTTDGDLITQNASMPARIEIGPQYSRLVSIASYPEWREKWFIEASFTTGGGNWTLSLTDIDPYAEVTYNDVTLLVSSGKGSLGAEIACSGTNPSTGLTCSAGDESLGIVFEPPHLPTTVEACLEVTEFIACYTLECDNTSHWKLVETPNNAQTIITEGNTHAGHGAGAGAGMGDAYKDYPLNLCAVFTFTTPGKKTIRAFNRFDVSIPAAISERKLQTVGTDGDGTNGIWRIRPIR